LAFEHGKPVDKTFNGIRKDLAQSAPRYAREYTDAQGYKADVPIRTAACRGSACSRQNSKVLKGELRFGILVDYDGEHSSWYDKHWQCMSEYDLEQAKQHFDHDADAGNSFHGIEALPTEYRQVVIDTLKTGKLVEPPKPEPAAPVKASKPRARKKNEVKGMAKETIKEESEEDRFKATLMPKRGGHKRAREEMDVTEEESVPRSRRAQAK